MYRRAVAAVKFHPFSFFQAPLRKTAITLTSTAGGQAGFEVTGAVSLMKQI
jgi:hypothetical protein